MDRPLLHPDALRFVEEARLPTRHGDFRLRVYVAADGKEHLALLRGNPAEAAAPLTRVHSECLTGDALFSLRCDCGPQLAAALAHIADAGCGVLVYLRQEGRGSDWPTRSGPTPCRIAGSTRSRPTATSVCRQTVATISRR
jgi:GTP cyclohydrolase II (EC 3.5.4.25)